MSTGDTGTLAPDRATVPDTAAATQLLLQELPLARPTVVVDVGANPINEAPYKALLQMGGCDVIGFEPQAEAFEALKQIKSSRERYFPFAVGDGSLQELKIYRSSGMTSTLEPYAPAAKTLGKPRIFRVIDRIPMQTVALDSVEDITRFDLLKIDIQGGEVAVFKGAAKKLSQVMAVIVELRHMQLYENEPMASGVDSDLRMRGFVLHKFMFNKSLAINNSQMQRLKYSAVREQLIDGDGVYIRNLMELDRVEDEGLLHLAVMASGIFSSQTVVLASLDELARRGVIDPSLAGRYVDALPSRLRVG